MNLQSITKVAIWAMLAAGILFGAGDVIAQTASPVSSRIIVKFRTSQAGLQKSHATSADDVRALAKRVGLMMTHTHALGGDLHVMAIAAPVTRRMLDDVGQDATVEFAEVDHRRFAHALPDDPGYAHQWYLQNDVMTPAAINAIGAWDVATGSDATVIAILDTGVLFDHPDLGRAPTGRLLAGYDFVSPDSSGTFAAANDGSGRDSDAADPGDWVSQADKQNALFKDCSVENSSWHGTRVAGILGAASNNGRGVTGVTWKGLLLPVRVLGKCGGYDSDIIAGMQWAAGIAVPGVPNNPDPATIENLSLGAAGACSRSYQTVVSLLIQRGVLVVASAGNEGAAVESPANCTGVVAVAGVRQAGTKVGYSNLGPEVAISAPAGNCGAGSSGVCLYSLDTTTNTGGTSSDPAGYVYTNQIGQNLGTSFSAPIVAGIAGLMHALNANLTPSMMFARLQEGATPFPGQSLDTLVTAQCAPEPQGSSAVQNTECVCTTSTCGAGLANALGAVNAAKRPIASIAVASAVAAGQNVNLDASHSAAACGRTVAAYEWTVGEGSSTFTIINPTDAIASVVAPASGSITLHLKVTDDQGAVDESDVTIFPNFASTFAPANAGTTACPTAATVTAQTPVTPSSTTSGAASAHSGGGGGFDWYDSFALLLLTLGRNAKLASARLIRAWLTLGDF